MEQDDIFELLVLLPTTKMDLEFHPKPITRTDTFSFLLPHLQSGISMTDRLFSGPVLA